MNKQPVTLGTDPELFLSRNNRVLASEHIIPETGLRAQGSHNAIVVRDGVQVELNPTSASTIPALGQNIATALKTLRTCLNKQDRVSIDWTGTVDVNMDELNTLSPATRLLGCKPSDNYYGATPINVDPLKFVQRSAGGHIHLGLNPGARYAGATHQAARELIPVADILVGNTCVLLDRDPRAAERRINYGRAGEYRRPKYGVEYRTLSNFWLRNPTLFDFAFGMMEMALATFAPGHEYGTGDPEADLAPLVKIQNFQTAINTNDYKLARASFESIRPYLVSPHVSVGMFPLDQSNIDKFLAFSEGIQVNGLAHYFPSDPLVAWCDEPHVDFQTFLKGLNA